MKLKESHQPLRKMSSRAEWYLEVFRVHLETKTLQDLTELLLMNLCLSFCVKDIVSRQLSLTLEM